MYSIETLLELPRNSPLKEWMLLSMSEKDDYHSNRGYKHERGRICVVEEKLSIVLKGIKGTNLVSEFCRYNLGLPRPSMTNGGIVPEFSNRLLTNGGPGA
jgi:hypothetical protein